MDVKKDIKNRLFANTFFIFQSLIDSWKSNDASIIAAFLRGENYREAATYAMRDISLMWRREQTLRIREYKASKAVLHQIVTLK